VRPALFVGVIAILQHDAPAAPLGYAGLAVAALASWVGVPGPGEAALVAAGILASRGGPDLPLVLGCAWVGATVGGIAGWLLGLRAAEPLASPSGPLAAPRRAALERGGRFYERFGVLAVFLTPSWVAGIHGMRARRYLPANALAALVWAAIYGAGGALIGPSVADVADDFGLLGGIVIGGLVIAGIVAATTHAYRKSA
jgi:membrane protein DedA with SNARE-associated domain